MKKKQLRKELLDGLIMVGAGLVGLTIIFFIFQPNQEKLLQLEGQVATLEESLGVIPTEFIATLATTSDPLKFSFLIGTSTSVTDVGSTTLAVYGSTTLQTWADTEYAFVVLNQATTSILQVDTLNASTTIRNALTVNSLTVGSSL